MMTPNIINETNTNKLDADIENQYLLDDEYENQQKIQTLRISVINFLYCVLYFEFVVNTLLVFVLFGLLVTNLDMVLYVSLLFVTHIIKLTINFSVKYYQSGCLHQQIHERNINNPLHCTNLNSAIGFAILFVIYFAYGSYITHGEKVGLYYFAKIVNVNIIVAEILKAVALACGTNMHDYGGYYRYLQLICS